MFEIWARERETNKDIRMGFFWDERQFDFEIDKIDRKKYKEVMIMNEEFRCVKFVEFKDFTPYFEKYKKRELKKNGSEK